MDMGVPLPACPSDAELVYLRALRMIQFDNVDPDITEWTYEEM